MRTALTLCLSAGLLACLDCGARGELLDGATLAAGSGGGSTSVATTAVGATTTSSGSGGDSVCAGDALVPFDPPTGSTCGCLPAAGFALDGDCGPLELVAPFIRPPELEVPCGTSVPFGRSDECDGLVSYVVGACRGEGHAPCALLRYRQDGGAPAVLMGGLFVDGAGEPWTLEDGGVDLDPDQPGQYAGHFFGTARSAGGDTLSLEGRFEICSAFSTVCPK